MKRLLDENLRYRMGRQRHASDIDAQHLASLGLKGKSDEPLWRYARDEGWMIVSRENDVRQLAFLRGAPPKGVWLSCRNASTDTLASCLIHAIARLKAFQAEPGTALRVLRA